jgi:hypothetical protein
MGGLRLNSRFIGFQTKWKRSRGTVCGPMGSDVLNSWPLQQAGEAAWLRGSLTGSLRLIPVSQTRMRAENAAVIAGLASVRCFRREKSWLPGLGVQNLNSCVAHQPCVGRTFLMLQGECAAFFQRRCLRCRRRHVGPGSDRILHSTTSACHALVNSPFA